MHRQKGSLTIFSVISLLLVTATIFALLEGSRRLEICRFADLQAESAVESLFAKYNSCLWEEYHLLATDMTQAELILEAAAGARNGDGVSLLKMKSEEVDIIADRRLTDGNGRVFVQSVSAYMKDNLAYEVVKELYNQYEAIQVLLGENEMDLGDIDEALEELRNIETTEEKKSVGTTGTTQKSDMDVMEVLEQVRSWKEKGILELVIEDTDVVSEADADFNDGVLERKLETGTMSIVEETEWIDRVLLQQYLLTYMSNYRACDENRALRYELEYLLGKQTDDIGNLKSVVGKLLAIREAANFIYLLSDSEKVLQAEGMAIMCVGASVNPAIIQVVKLALLTAWAFIESILDVRALLAGKKIQLLKNDASWTTSLENLTIAIEEFAMAKENDLGISYEGYLGILLLFEEEENLAMHAMNLQEATIRMNYGDESFQMDKLVTGMEAEVTYSYAPIFPFLDVLGMKNKWNYRVQGAAEYNYY